MARETIDMPEAGEINIQRLWDLTEAHIKAAMGERRTMGKLLRELAAIARPGEGAPKILIAIARIAGPTCDWIEGSLRVEISCFEGLAAKTQIVIAEDLGGGVMEVVFPRLVLDVPIVELERSLRLAPRAVEPLKLKLLTAAGSSTTAPLRLILTHKKTRTTKALPTFEVAEDCLRRSLPPTVRKSLAPPPEIALARSSKEPVLRRRVRPTASGSASASAPASASASKPKSKAPTKTSQSAETLPAPPSSSSNATAAKAKGPPPQARKKSWRPVISGQDADGKPMMMEIPRPPKVLDFGDLLPPKSQRAPSKPAPKKPSRSPPAR